jgi:hypothetical protein
VSSGLARRQSFGGDAAIGVGPLRARPPAPSPASVLPHASLTCSHSPVSAKDVRTPYVRRDAARRPLTGVRPVGWSQVRWSIALRTRAASGASMPDVPTRGGRLAPERATRLAFVSPACRQRLIVSGWVARAAGECPRSSVAQVCARVCLVERRSNVVGETLRRRGETGRELVAAAVWIVTAGRSLSIRPMPARRCVAKDY